MFKKYIDNNYKISFVFFILISNLFCFDKLVGIMVDFVPDNDPQTSGDGTFLNEVDLGFINYDNIEKCSSDNFLVDKPPHNSDYFLLQMKAVKNYYNSVSNGSIDFDIEVIDTVLTMEHSMKYFATSEERIGLLFSHAIDKVNNSLDQGITLKVKNSTGITDYDDNGNVLFVVFHAGLGQESSTDFDPTIYDIRSAFVDEGMLDNNWVLNNNINKGIVLPETLNIIYYDTVEDNIPIPTSINVDELENFYCNNQNGMSGLFAYLLGYAFGFPPLHNFETGQTRVGKFDLMDVGFFNGRGVIPSSPSAWIRSNSNFDFNTVTYNITSQDSVGPFKIPQRLTEHNGSLEDIIYRFDISSNEYFLIEHRSNLLNENLSTSIDSEYEQLRRDFDEDDNFFLEWFNADNIYPPAWFDVLKNEFSQYIEIDSKNNPIYLEYPNEDYNVITKVNNYDAGLPGSGLLIWHINEPLYSGDGYAYGINDNIFNKAITLEEGDGSQDIGELNPGLLEVIENEKFQSGKADDFWYYNNTQYFETNNVNDFSGMLFNNNSFPSTKSISGAPSNFSIEILPKDSNTPNNIIEIVKSNNSSSKISDILIIEDAIDIIGNDGQGCVYYLDSNDLIFEFCENDNFSEQVYFSDFGNNKILVTKDDNDIDSFSSFALNGIPIAYPEIISYQNQSYLVDYNQNYYYDEKNNDNEIVQDEIDPMGYFDSDLVDINNEVYLEVSGALSLADFDDDIYDEKIIISNGILDVKNYGDSSVNGFPLYGSYRGKPLVLNIFNDYDGPEIVIFNGDKIDIISSDGDVLCEIPIFNDEKISALKWRTALDEIDDVAIINGNRLYIFENAYVENQSFWMNFNSRPSNYPLVTGMRVNSNNSIEEGIDLEKVYNYPNPVSNNKTTFRFFVFDSQNIEINVFDVTGKRVAKLFKENLIENEYNEIVWDSINLPIGLYFASVQSDKNQSKILKVVIE